MKFFFKKKEKNIQTHTTIMYKANISLFVLKICMYPYEHGNGDVMENKIETLCKHMKWDVKSRN